MAIDTHTTEPNCERFEERLLATILRDYDELTADVRPRPEAPTRARHRVRRLLWAIPAVTAAAAAAAIVALEAGPPRAIAPQPPRARPIHIAATPSGRSHAAAVRGHEVLYRLASESRAAPALTGRYVILSETDTDTNEPGQVSKRTSVDDTQTGASVTYQVPFAGTGAPSALREGPDPQQTAAAYASLPTDPSALRAQLLATAQRQWRQGQVQLLRKRRLEHAPDAKLPPEPSDDELIYEQANDMLWSPVVSPTLRAALYRVLAAGSGFSLDQHATDTFGRPAIAMTRDVTVDGTPESDITYENPQTGAVLAQIWKIGPETITSVYQPATSSQSIPPNPYGN